MTNAERDRDRQLDQPNSDEYAQTHVEGQMLDGGRLDFGVVDGNQEPVPAVIGHQLRAYRRMDERQRVVPRTVRRGLHGLLGFDGTGRVDFIG